METLCVRGILVNIALEDFGFALQFSKETLRSRSHLTPRSLVFWRIPQLITSGEFWFCMSISNKNWSPGELLVFIIAQPWWTLVLHANLHGEFFALEETINLIKSKTFWHIKCFNYLNGSQGPNFLDFSSSFHLGCWQAVHNRVFLLEERSNCIGFWSGDSFLGQILLWTPVRRFSGWLSRLSCA